MNKNRVEGAAKQGEWAQNHKALVTGAKWRGCGGYAMKVCVLTWGDLALFLKGRRPDICQAQLQGRYWPTPVRKVMIPKPDGSQPELGIPSVTDRLIQQALLQVLQPLIDPSFSDHSHGFRPGRRAHDAVKAARAYVQSGKRVVVDVDLAKFFDRVNHDILIDRRGRQGVGGARLSLCALRRRLQRLRRQHQGRRAGDGLPQEAVRQTPASDQRSQERRGQCLRAQVPGVCAVGGQGQRSQMCSVPKALDNFKARIRQLTGRSGG